MSHPGSRTLEPGSSRALLDTSSRPTSLSRTVMRGVLEIITPTPAAVTDDTAPPVPGGPQGASCGIGEKLRVALVVPHIGWQMISRNSYRHNPTAKCVRH